MDIAARRGAAEGPGARQQAIRLANDTEYGLAATVWTQDVKRAIRLTKAIRSGTVGVNGYQLLLPFTDEMM